MSEAPAGDETPAEESGAQSSFLEELRSSIGRVAAPRAALDPVGETMIRQWCEAFADDNPVYLDAERARATAHGRLVAPPAMLDVWLMPGQARRPATPGHPFGEVLPRLDAAGFTGVVATNAEQEYLRMLVPGDTLTAHESLEDVSGPKRTGLGDGYFVTTLTEYRDAAGEPVGRMRFRILKFRPPERPPPGAPTPEGAAERMRRPRPGISRDTRFFWDGLERGELRIQECGGCGALRHPPGVRCPDCGSYEQGFRVAGGRGRVYSFVEVHHPQVPAFDYPLLVALVELDEGTRLLANLAGVDPDEARIGMEVEVAFEKVDEELTLPFFRPVRPARREASPAAEELRVGAALDPCPVPITSTLVVAGAMATRDFTPVHHDVEKAKGQGTPDIFMNIMSTNALCTRYVTDWAGPDARLEHLRVRLGVPNFPGDTMVLRGSLESVEPVAEGRRVRVKVRGTNRLGDHATAFVDVLLPGPDEGATSARAGER
ncbi:MAG: FAS1-like dehydratase domain-containing protein [Myxococcota bacterium]